jgi:hypothetical protein
MIQNINVLQRIKIIFNLNIKDKKRKEKKIKLSGKVLLERIAIVQILVA